MNRSKLAHHIQSLASLLDDLSAEIDRKDVDQFAIHVYRSRRQCRIVEQNDTKSGKRGERFAWESYVRAQKYGFRGSIHDWCNILWAKMREDPQSEAP